MAFYSTKRWQQMRLDQLQAQPFCLYCQQIGVRTPATIVDHVTPHRGDHKLFFDARNLQCLCKTCHDSTKQRYERSGTLKGGTATGIPLDPNHHWNTGASTMSARLLAELLHDHNPYNRTMAQRYLAQRQHG